VFLSYYPRSPRGDPDLDPKCERTNRLPQVDALDMSQFCNPVGLQLQQQEQVRAALSHVHM